jgi:hypothetical protein
MVIAVSRWPKPITGYRQLAGGCASMLGCQKIFRLAVSGRAIRE